jgi:LmbE family N-acetylglucosaminyl deacetylase
MGTIVNHQAKSLRTLNLSGSLCILVLAPHPDDFDAIGVTMRYFKENGNPIYVAVATSGASGVEDSFCSPPSRDVKTKIREKEQRKSCDYFELSNDHLVFLRLEEDENGHILDNANNLNCMRRHLMDKRPTLVFLPHWHDTNLSHQNVYKLFCKAERDAEFPIAAFLNRDPKTINMRYDIYCDFGEKEAAWKGRLLRFHRSQHQRNMNQRGHGMDERILRIDRESAEACSINMPYAEVFELEFFGATNFEEIL